MNILITAFVAGLACIVSWPLGAFIALSGWVLGRKG